MNKPSILGGKPAFKETFPMTRPSLPDFACLQSSIEETFKTGLITNSKYVCQFEIACSNYLGVKEAVAVSSATSALILAIKALELQGEVIMPSFTFSATAHCLTWNGLRPVFVDCLPQSYNLDPAAVARAITDKTSAILGVYIFGNPPDIDALEAIAKRHNLKLIFDSAHSFGAKYRHKSAGGFGDVEIFSLSPTKPLTAGEGGLITTNDTHLSQRLRLLRNYGNEPNYDCQWVGLNARMLEFSAILGLKNLERIEEIIARRNNLALCYQRQLSSLPGIQFQEIEPNNRSSFKDLSILIEPTTFGLTRDQLALALRQENIENRKYFYPPIHLQKAYQHLCPNPDDLATTMRVSNSILCLPFYPGMRDEDVNKIAEVIDNIHSSSQIISRSLTNCLSSSGLRP